VAVVASALLLLVVLVTNRPAGIALGHRTAPSARDRAEAAGIDVDGLADRLAHTIRSTGTGTLSTGDAAYRASFDATGFTLAPTGERGSLHLALDAPTAKRWTSTGNVASRIAGDGLTERVTATRGAVEWDVVLAHRPATRGDLVLRSAIEGLASADLAGDHWVLSLEGGAELQLGELVVKDATGAVLHRALPSIEGGRLSMRVPASVLARATYPLTVDPTVSAEHAVGATPSQGDQTAPAVAWNGTEFLIAWLDSRIDGEDIFAARVTPGGGLLDPDGIPIPTGHFSVGRPSVASNGSDFLVVWSDARNGDHSRSDVFGTRISSAGAVLDVLSIDISTDGPNELLPVVAWNGTNYLVVWDETRLVATRVNSAGTVIDAKQFPLSDANGDEANPAITSDGTNWFVVWEDYRNGNADIYGARIANNKTKLDGLGFPIATGSDAQATPSVAFNGTRYLAGWLRTDGSGGHVEARRVSKAGALLGTTATALSSSILELEPSVGARGSTFIVTWEEFRLETSSFDVRGRRINSNGAVPDSDSFPIGDSSTHELLPAIADGATSSLVVWQDQRSSIDIRGARLGTGKTILDPDGITLSTEQTPNSEAAPSIAWNGSEYLVVWEDDRSGTGSDIYGTRVDPSGAVLDPGGIPISTATGDQLAPSVAAGGAAFLVAWGDSRSGASDVYGSLVLADGTVDEPDGIAISTATGEQSAVSVGWNGGTFVVAWQDRRSGTSFDVYGARVTIIGVVLEPAGKALSTATGDQTVPSVATTDGTTLVVWQDSRSGNPDVWGTRFDTSGTALDSSGVAIDTATSAQTGPTVAWTDGTYLVAWADSRNGVTNHDIFGRTLDENAALLGNDFPVTTAAHDQFDPVVAFNGTFLVVYLDLRSNSTYDVYATRVKIDGTVTGSDIPVSATPFTELGAAVSAGSGTKWSVAYPRTQLDPGSGIYLRTVSPK
jgi:hypothetical protein